MESSLDRSQGVFVIAGSREAGALCAECGRSIAVGDYLRVCERCGSTHHQPCWERSGGCGGYTCVKAERDLKNASGNVLRITTDELEHVSLDRPARVGAGFVSQFDASSSTHSRRTNRRSIASLILALFGIIPGIGLLLGFLAVVTGGAVLASRRGSRNAKTWPAIVGVLLGLFDIVFSAVLLGMFAQSLPIQAGAGVQFVETPPDLEEIRKLDPPIRRAMLANVMIQNQLGWGGIVKAFGSGVILEIKNGEALIVTNRHVVDPEFARSGGAAGGKKVDSSRLSVEMVGQGYVPAKVEWIAPGTIDLALVRAAVKSDAPAEALWRQGVEAKVGDDVFAIGNPQGLGWSHTRGTISQFRSQVIDGGKIRVIQTQTAINHGNSGGGLYDAAGRLVGINTWTNDKSVSEGLSFAIAFSTLLDLAPPGLGDHGGAEAP